MTTTNYIHREDVHNKKSSDIIAPTIVKLLNPDSIVDFGCGIGTWLSSFKSLGVSNVLGIDGEYVDQKLLQKYLLPAEFVSKNLNREIDLNRKFDLSICLEVAEHLPLESADNIVKSLVNHSDSILFSAAIPGQGGQNHLNEQWPDYWIHKFAQYGYKVYDPLRPIIWDDQRIDPWYRQNIFLFTIKTFSFPIPLYSNIVLPEFYQKLGSKNELLEQKLNNIIDGKLGVLFYVKRIFLSIFKFGGKRVR